MAIQYCDYEIKGTLDVKGTSTFADDLILDANSGSSPDIFLYNVSNNYARILFDTSNQFLIKIGTANEMTMSATATTFDSSITAQSAVLSGPSDSMLTLNQTGTDTGWSYINFQTSNVRNYYVGQDSSKNFNIYNDVIDVLGFSMSYTNANITLGADLIVSGGDITLIGTGRIQGVDTVSASTDAANKAYVDAAVAGVPQGDITNVSTTSPITGGGSSGSVTIAHANSGATAGAYTNANVTVDATGHVTSISSGSDAQGVTSIATGSGISGGTITSTGTLTVGAGDGLAQSSTGLLMSGSYSGSFTAGSTSSTSRTIRVLAGDSYTAGLEAYGSSQGTGYAYVGQASNYGGGVFYNGDGSPSFAAGEVADTIGFYRRSADVNTAVFSFPHNSSSVTFNSDITVSGGDIILGGTGRIQGIDTVTASTDAANKAYVDAHGGGVGPFLPIANPTFTGTLTGPTANFTGDVTIGGRDLIFSNTGTNDANITSSLGINFIVGSSGTISGLEIDTFGGVTTYNVLTTGGSIIVGGGGIQLNGTGRIEGIDTITASTDAVNKAYVDARDGTMSNWNLTADSGGSMSIGQGTTVDIAGGTNITTSRTGATVQINNSITNNNQLTNGAGYTTNTGTVTGSGATNRVPFWSSSSALSSTAAFTFISNVLYAETAFHVKTGSTLVQYASQGDTDTGLGNFDGNGQLSLLSNNKAVFTAKDDKNTFNAYVSTSVATTGSLNPNQSQQALTSDTLAVLAVDPTGNIVRGSQEGTWTFTKAQLDALTTSTTSGTTLIAAPGANKAIIVEESNLMIKYSGTGTMSSNSFVIRQAHNGDATAEITRLPSGQINTIMSSAPANPSYGFYSRDLPLYNNDGRSFVTNKATFLSRINTNATPTNLVSISIKLKYRMFNASTF